MESNSSSDGDLFEVGGKMWGEIPSTSKPVMLSVSEAEAFTRMPRPLALKGPKIYQPQGRNGLQIKKERKKPSILGRCAKLQEVLRNPEATGRADPATIELLTPVHLTGGGPFDVRFFHEDEERRMNKVDDDDDEMSATEANRRLRGAAAEVMAAVGFAFSSEQALQTVTDVVEDVLRRLCVKIKDVHELEGDKNHGFADCLERALAETNLCGGGVAAIRRYSIDEMVGLHNRLAEAARTAILTNEADQTSQGGGEPIYLLNSEDNIPEIHFPSGSPGLMDHATPQLETGLQMLQSLEQGSLGSSSSVPSTSTPAVEEAAAAEPMSQESNSALLLVTVSPQEKKLRRS